MHEALKRVACCRVDRSSDAGPAQPRRLGRLPDDVLTEQVQRLAYLSTVVAGIWATALIVNLLIAPLATGVSTGALRMIVDAVGLAMSAAMLLYVKVARHAPQTKADVGLVYMVSSAACVALINTTVPLVPEETTRVSWIAVGILVFAMFAPASPGKMLVASLIAATMDPLAVWLKHLQGNPVPSVGATIVLFIPNYLSALVAAVSSHALLKLGRRLSEAREMGSYRLVERLDQGGMGEVWRAEHALLARSSAIKLIKPEMLCADSEIDIAHVQRRFEREAQATAALNSPHTIQLYDFGLTNEGQFYYAMELLTGRDLQSLVRDFGPLPADRTAFILRQVCHSLADAHARGLVHCDIKPANIYLCRMGLEYDFAKVLDFGLVRVRRNTGSGMLTTVEDRTTGTPAYMAPELITSNAEIDRRADVYSVGCVAYFLLTGQLVFEADTRMKMLVQHLQAEPIPPSQRSELPIPPNLDRLVLDCLHKNPDERPQDAGDLLRRTYECMPGSGWNQERARHWWQAHLAEFTGPLQVAATAPQRHRPA